MSTHYLNLLLCVAAALLTMGCDTLDEAQYVVEGASPADKMAIRKAVTGAATEAGLVDQTRTSKVTDTIVYYLEPVPHFPVSLGARMVGESSVVDLSCFHPGVGKTPVFKTAEFRLTTVLLNDFGMRLIRPDRSHFIPLKYELK